MLSTLINLLYFVKNLLYFCLILSYKTGYLIITGASLLVNSALVLLENLSVLCGVLQEDFYIFLTDVWLSLCSVGKIVYEFFALITNCIITVYESAKCLLFSLVTIILNISNTFSNCLSRIWYMLGSTLEALKYFLVLLGSGIWFVVTLVPLVIISTITLFNYYINRAVLEIREEILSGFEAVKSCFTTIYCFFTDVPFEAFAGLIAGICLMYIMLKFHIIFYRFLYYMLLSMLEFFRRHVNSTSLWLRSYFWRQRTVVVQETSSENVTEDENEEDNRVGGLSCVVCLEHPRNVLFFPCKHVCICVSCDKEFKRINVRTCPVCRTRVERSLKVFL